MMRTETFEEKLEYSKKLLEKLMKPDITLEDSVRLYEEGINTIKEAEQLIEDAKTKISIIEQSDQEVRDE